LIEQRRAEDAQEFNMTKAVSLGQFKGHEVFAKRKIERLEAIAYLDSKGTVAERKAKSKLDPMVIAAGDEHANLVEEVVTLQLQMDGNNALIRIWQTQEATLRKGV